MNSNSQLVESRSLLFGVILSMLIPWRLSAQEQAQFVVFLPGTRSVLMFDRLDLTDGSVLKISPNWTKEQKLSRPPKLEKVQTILYVDYEKADSKGRIGISTVLVAKLTLWEKMAMNDVQLCIREERLDDAKYLLDEIEKFNPEWQPEQRKTLLNQVRLLLAVKQCRSDVATNTFELGLATLEDLRREAPQTTGLAAAFEAVCLPLAIKYYGEKRYPESRDFLARVIAVNPQSENALQFTSRLQKDAEALLTKAETAMKAKRGREATTAALEALQIRPQDAALKIRALVVLEAFQSLKVACYENAGALDPFNATQLLERQVAPLLFDRLVEPDETGLNYFNGPIVKQSKAVDGYRRVPGGGNAIEYTFELQPGQTYSDGTPITSADIAGTVRGLQDRTAASHDSELARLLIDVEVKDPFRFSILTRPHPYPQSFFVFPVVPERTTVRLPKRGDPASRQPVGSGPFVVAGLPTATESLRLESNPKFRGVGHGQPFVREIAFPRYQKKGEGHAEEDLLQRRIHMISDPSPLQLIRLTSAAKDFQTRPLLSNSVWVLAINHRRPLLKDREVRRAMMLAIDREAILKRWFSAGGNSSAAGGHVLVTGPFPPQSPANDPKVELVKPQPSVAKSKVAAAMAGAKEAALTLKYPANDLTIELAINQMKRDLEAVGFKIRLDAKLPNDLLHEVGDQHDFDLAYWRIDHDNIVFNVAKLFDGSATAMGPGGSNFSGYAPQKLIQMFVDLRNEQVGDKIWQIQHRIHRHLHEEMVIIPLWRLDNFVVYTNRLRGRAAGGKAVDLPIDRSTVFRRTEEWYLEPDQ